MKAALAAVLLFLGAIPACSVTVDVGRRGEPDVAADDPTRPTSELLLLGARVFHERCAPCHGDKGRGDGILADSLAIQPRNYREDPFRWGNTPSGIVETIAGGRSGVMPPFRDALSETEIWAVAHLVWSWMPAEHRASGPGRAPPPAPPAAARP